MQAKKDDAVRRTAGYQLKKLIGNAPTLASDATYERDMEGVPVLQRPPKGNLCPFTVTVGIGSNKVVATDDIRRHLGVGTRVRIGRWVFHVAHVESKTAFQLDSNIDWEFDVQPPGKGLYKDPWGRTVEKPKRTRPSAAAGDANKPVELIRGLELYTLPPLSTAAKLGKSLLGKVTQWSEGIKPVERPKLGFKGRFKDEYAAADAADKAALRDWEKKIDPDTGAVTFFNSTTGETTTEDPWQAAKSRAVERAIKKEMVRFTLRG